MGNVPLALIAACCGPAEAELLSPRRAGRLLLWLLDKYSPRGAGAPRRSPLQLLDKYRLLKRHWVCSPLVPSVIKCCVFPRFQEARFSNNLPFTLLFTELNFFFFFPEISSKIPRLRRWKTCCFEKQFIDTFQMSPLSRRSPLPRLRVAYVSFGSAPEQIPDVVLRRNPESCRDWGFHTFMAAPRQRPLGRGTWLTRGPGLKSSLAGSGS